MNLFEEAAKILLGIAITGMVTAIIWLLKWCDRTDLKVHDLDRDIKHLQRQYVGISDLVAKLDLKDEQITTWFRKDFASIDRRLGQIELKIHVIEVRIKAPIAPGD